MGLSATLTVKLDCRSLGDTLLAELAGPVATLGTLVLPAPDDALQRLAAGAGSIDLAPLAGAVADLAQRAQPLLAGLPAPVAVFGPIGDALALVETATQHDLSQQVSGLLDRLRAELQPGAAGRPALPALLLQLLQVLSASAEGRVLKDLLAPLLGAAGVQLPTLAGLRDPLAAAQGALSSVAALMSLETVLADAQSLAATMAGLVHPVQLRSAVESLQAALHGGPLSLADFVAGLAADDSAGLAAARSAVADVAGQLTLLPERLNTQLGLAEATLVYLDIGRLGAEVDAARAALRGGASDADALGRVATRLAALLAPLLKLDAASLPAGQLGLLAARAEAEIASVAAAVAAIDVAAFVTPLADGIGSLSAPLRALDTLIGQAVVALRGVLDGLRQAVAALPFQAVADAIASVLAPVAAVLDAITALLDSIEAALQAAATTTGAALGAVEQALARFQSAIDGLFGEVRDAMAAVDLQAAVGQIGGRIQDFSEVLAQARLKPYLDTAQDAIGSASSVLEAVPFGLLPESMKAEVDAAVAPIKATDADAVQGQIEQLLGIGADGRFTPRDDLQAGLATLQRQYQDLLDLVEARHPRALLAEVDQRLQAIAERVRALEPGLTLAPVRAAIDSVKALLQGIDLAATLAPVQQVFDQILAALDAYAPSALVAPLQARIDSVRAQLLAQIGHSRWAPALDELAAAITGLLALADPTRLQAPLRSAFDEALALLARFPTLDAGRGLGTLVAALAGSSGLRVSANSMPAVRRWLAGEQAAAAALSARTAALAQAFAGTRSAVAAVDVDRLAPGLAATVRSLHAAVQALLQRLPPGSAERLAFEALLPRLDAAPALAGLQTNRARLLAGLDAAVGLAAQFAASGFSEADAGAQRLRLALAPLAPAAGQLRLLMAAAGIPAGQLSVVGVVQAVLAAVPPERMAALPMPLFQALRGRLQALLAAVLAPLQAALAELQSLLDAISLAPLAEAADAVVADVRSQVLALSPAALLAAPTASFNALRAAFVGSDPLAPVQAVIDTLRQLIASVLARLSLERLLAVPLAIYDDLLAQLRAVDPGGLLAPVFDELDTIAAEVADGLDGTVLAFKRLQDALPAGGGGSSVSISIG